MHRDVKPSNILIAARDFAYLIDFGIARAAEDTAMTSTGYTLGTFAYMAPERFSGTTDPRADVYSLACVLYEGLTGKRPYPGDSLEEQVAGHLTAPPPRSSSRSHDIATTFDGVVSRGMAKKPEDRFQTASELADAARVALTSSISAAEPTTPAQASTQDAPRFERKAVSKQPAQTNAERRASARHKLKQEMDHRAEQTRRRRLILVGTTVAAIVVIAAVAGILEITSRQQANDGASATASLSASTVPSEAAGSLPTFTAAAGLGANCQYPPSSQPASKEVKPPRTGKVPADPSQVSASLVTNRGHIGLLLENNESPCTVNNFASLSQQGYFNNTRCHRLTLSILQCGDPSADGTGGPGYQFANEYPTDQYPAGDWALHRPVVYPRGTLAMANAGPGTNGSQFFLVFKDTPLPPEYTIFGTIQQDGLETLDSIAKSGIAKGGEDGPPAEEVTITSAQLD